MRRIGCGVESSEHRRDSKREISRRVELPVAELQPGGYQAIYTIVKRQMNDMHSQWPAGADPCSLGSAISRRDLWEFMPHSSRLVERHVAGEFILDKAQECRIQESGFRALQKPDALLVSMSSLSRACLVCPRRATDPSPGPRRLVKAPSRSTLSPWEREEPAHAERAEPLCKMPEKILDNAQATL
jgi:hypothetical protein